MKMVSRDDRSVLQETKGAWHRAYNRKPFCSGTSFSMLADQADEHRDTARIAV
jgi:hypothetical protein